MIEAPVVIEDEFVCRYLWDRHLSAINTETLKLLIRLYEILSVRPLSLSDLESIKHMIDTGKMLND